MFKIQSMPRITAAFVLYNRINKNQMYHTEKKLSRQEKMRQPGAAAIVYFLRKDLQSVH